MTKKNNQKGQLNVKRIEDRIKLLESLLFVPSGGRPGGKWEEPLALELRILKTILL